MKTIDIQIAEKNKILKGLELAYEKLLEYKKNEEKRIGRYSGKQNS
ncbi:MAG: hypothetical protein ACOVNZ_03680 [Crocinitomicaceae bacterium]